MQTNKPSAQLLQPTTGLKIFDMIQYTTGFLEGELQDWPPNIQDPILEALERMADEVELPLTIIHSRFDVEPADEEGMPDRFYIHVIASEIVAADERYMAREKESLRNIISEIMNGSRSVN